MLVSVIIPAYKQEKTIKADIERIIAILLAKLKSNNSSSGWTY